MDALGPLAGCPMGTMGLSCINSPFLGENSAISSIDVLQDKKSSEQILDVLLDLHSLCTVWRHESMLSISI